MTSLFVSVLFSKRGNIHKQLVVSSPHLKTFDQRDVLVCIAIVIYSIIASASAPCKNQMIFSLATVSMLVFVWFFSKWYLIKFESIKLIEPDHALVGLIIIFIFLCMAVSGYDLYSYLRGMPSNRPSGLFMEPSHLVLYSTPLALAGISCLRTRLLSVMLTIFIFVLAYSLTFIVLFWVTSAIYFIYLLTKNEKLKQKVIKFTTLIALISIFVFTLHGGYIAERTQIKREAQTQNLSLQVYVNGWQLAKSTLFNTSAIGLGMGNMGCSTKINNEASQLTICLRDGSFLSSKIISELGFIGLIGIFLLLFYMYLTLKLATRTNFNLLTSGSIGLLLTLLFIRGLPYFSAPVIFCFMVMTKEIIKLRLHRLPRNGT